MMRLGILFSLLLLSFFARASEYILSPGQKLSLIGQSEALWVKDSDLLHIERRGKIWIFVASKKGSTTFKIDKQIHELHVLSPLAVELYQKIKSDLNFKANLDVKIRKGQIIVQGRIFRFEDWLDLQSQLEFSNEEYFMHAEMNDKIQKRANQYFQKLMQKSGLLPLPIFFSPWPELRLSKNDRHIEKYKEKLKPFGVQFVIDEKAIDLEPVVKIEMTVLEVNKNQQQILGLKWPDQAQAEISPTLSWDKLNLTLNALEKDGNAQILASPNVLCRSGKECQFFVGGEFPIQIITGKTRDVLWKNYGILLKFNPLADSSGRMSLALQSEVSYLDPSLRVDDIPALKVNRLSSQFDLEKSKVVILSGLLKEQLGSAKEQLPFLSKIPILGKLFQSENFQNEKSELVILVKPTLTNFENDNHPHHLASPKK